MVSSIGGVALNIVSAILSKKILEIIVVSNGNLETHAWLRDQRLTVYSLRQTEVTINRITFLYDVISMTFAEVHEKNLFTNLEYRLIMETLTGFAI